MSRFIRPALRALPRAVAVTPRARIVPAALSTARFMSRSYATGAPPVSATDPSLGHAQQLLEDGTRALEEGDLHKAASLYEESIKAKPTSGGYFNLGVVQYQLENREGAIEAWKQSIKLEPSADAYTNLGSAYMMSQPPRPAEAIQALTAAMEIEPNDPEIQFNLAAILEATDELETALTLYKKAHSGGIERAAANIRNVGGKIVAKRLREEEGKGGQ